MNSTIKKLKQQETPEQQSLDALIPIIEYMYPNEDTDDIETLRILLNKEFNMSFTKEDIIYHYVVQIEIEDRQLIYKHYVGH